MHCCRSAALAELNELRDTGARMVTLAAAAERRVASLAARSHERSAAALGSMAACVPCSAMLLPGWQQQQQQRRQQQQCQMQQQQQHQPHQRQRRLQQHHQQLAALPGAAASCAALAAGVGRRRADAGGTGSDCLPRDPTASAHDAGLVIKMLRVGQQAVHGTLLLSVHLLLGLPSKCGGCRRSSKGGGGKEGGGGSGFDAAQVVDAGLVLSCDRALLPECACAWELGGAADAGCAHSDDGCAGDGDDLVGERSKLGHAGDSGGGGDRGSNSGSVFLTLHAAVHAAHVLNAGACSSSGSSSGGGGGITNPLGCGGGGSSGDGGRDGSGSGSKRSAATSGAPAAAASPVLGGLAHVMVRRKCGCLASATAGMPDVAVSASTACELLLPGARGGGGGCSDVWLAAAAGAACTRAGGEARSPVACGEGRACAAMPLCRDGSERRRGWMEEQPSFSDAADPTREADGGGHVGATSGGDGGNLLDGRSSGGDGRVDGGRADGFHKVEAGVGMRSTAPLLNPCSALQLRCRRELLVGCSRDNATCSGGGGGGGSLADLPRWLQSDLGLVPLPADATAAAAHSCGFAASGEGYVGRPGWGEGVGLAGATLSRSSGDSLGAGDGRRGGAADATADAASSAVPFGVVALSRGVVRDGGCCFGGSCGVAADVVVRSLGGDAALVTLLAGDDAELRMMEAGLRALLARHVGAEVSPETSAGREKGGGGAPVVAGGSGDFLLVEPTCERSCGCWWLW